VITTQHADYAETCEMLVWAGRKKGRPWYEHFVLASNARMTEFQGALLLGQLRRLPEQNACRTANARRLQVAGEMRALPGVPPRRAIPPHLLFRYRPEAFAAGQRRFRRLRAEGITGAFAGAMPLCKNPRSREKFR
jgi:dTDP-4-amino-4,6-dideoxygalactose transaminase